jgi:hypothetical protein
MAPRNTTRPSKTTIVTTTEPTATAIAHSERIITETSILITHLSAQALLVASVEVRRTAGLDNRSTIDRPIQRNHRAPRAGHSNEPSQKASLTSNADMANNSKQTA